MTTSRIASQAAHHAVVAAIDRSRRLLSVQQTAQQLNVSIRTVQRLIADDELPARRIGGTIRIMQGDLDDYVENAGGQGSGRSLATAATSTPTQASDQARNDVREAG
jgi:excisionase family DNA binding protein